MQTASEIKLRLLKYYRCQASFFIKSYPSTLAHIYQGKHLKCDYQCVTLQNNRNCGFFSFQLIINECKKQLHYKVMFYQMYRNLLKNVIKFLSAVLGKKIEKRKSFHKLEFLRERKQYSKHRGKLNARSLLESHYFHFLSFNKWFGKKKRIKIKWLHILTVNYFKEALKLCRCLWNFTEKPMNISSAQEIYR